jgi:2Fe-2S ferredoxin
MPIIIVVAEDGAERTLTAAPGRSLMQILRDGGFEAVLAICGGSCSCGTCHVHVEAQRRHALPSMSPQEHELLDMLDHRTADSRLACQIAWTEALDGLRISIAPIS